MTYRRWIKQLDRAWPEEIVVVFNDGQRVIAKDASGTVMFDGSKWLFDKCFDLGYHV